MHDGANQLVTWYQECAQLCVQLRQALRDERAALVAFQMPQLAEATMRKEQATRALQTRRQRMRDVLLKVFGTQESASIADKLPESLRADWTAADVAWRREWAETYALCEQNQRFLKHSLRNLGVMLDHFKRLIGEKPTYSAKGTRIDKPFEGKVIEGRY